MYKGNKEIHAQVLEPMMEGSFPETIYHLVHLVYNMNYNFLCGKNRYKIWMDTRKKVTCSKCLECFEDVRKLKSGEQS